jgi:protein-tyrosine phosphatase
MFSKLFGKKKEPDPYRDQQVPGNANWGFLGADMHSHLIPGIDDGAKTMEDSLAMVRAMKDMGYRTLITTPHVMIDFYPNTTQTITAGLAALQDAVRQNNIDIAIKAAAEYYMDESFIDLIGKEPLLILHQNEVLVEFSMLYEPPMLFEVIYKLQLNNYRPVIAHPERYVFFHKEPARYREFKERGCLMQLNMLSVTGYYGRSVKAAADHLLSKNMYDYCGSDMHHEKHAATLKAMANTKDYLTFVNYPFLNSRLCI